MKRIIPIIALLFLAVSAQAQTYNLHKTDGTVLKFSASEIDYLDFSETVDYQAVDLGLPSGLKWANMNVGAKQPEDCGDYFAWGETTGYGKEDDHTFDWENYALTTDGGSTFTACTNANGILLAEYDAATANMGGDWRMPTKNELEELFSQCTRTWQEEGNTEYSGVPGLKLTGTNGNSIFLPAAGYRSEATYVREGTFGYYRSASLYEGSSQSTYYEYFSSGGYSPSYAYRFRGFSVRAVLAE